MTVYAQPGTEGSVVSYKSRYDNWIGGEYVAPVNGNYFEYLAQEVRRLPSMAARYSHRHFGRLLVAASKPLLGLLALLSMGDRGSSEALCFGIHIVARRQT